MPGPLAFFPGLPILVIAGGQRLGAAGLRLGSAEDFFSEVYLDQAAEALIAGHFGVEVPRSSILELGHFAAQQTGAGRAVIRVIGALTEQLPHSWMLATLNRPMRRNFRRIGIPLVELAPAHAGCLGANRVAWGRYYESDPRVVVAHLATGRDSLARAGLLGGVNLHGGMEALR